MKKWKKITALFLALMMSCSVAMPTTAASDQSQTENIQEESVLPEMQFADVDVSLQDTEAEFTEELEIQSEEWTASDFVYSEMEQTLNGCNYERQIRIQGPAVAGLSEAGKRKYETNKHLVLPSENEQGEMLVGVADGAFKGIGLQSVTFPEGMLVDYDDTVTHVVNRRGNFVIGVEAFANNELTEVNLPEGVIAIMSSAFRSNQLAKLTLPRTFWWLENSAFAKNNLTSVGFPKTCDFQCQIHAFAFAYNQLTSVRLPDYTEVVEKKAFLWNPGMEECPKNAPEGESEFGGVVYMYTDNPELADLERIHHMERTADSQRSWHQKLIIGSQPGGETDWKLDDFTIDGTAITGLSESGIEKRKVNRELVLPDQNAEGTYITEIAASSDIYGLFGAENEGFETLKLPAKIEKIGNKAFCNIGLKKVTFPNTLKEIGVAAFQMNKLTSIELPDSVVTLGGGAFGTNPELASLVLSKSLKEIPAGAFGCSTAGEYMKNLTKLTIPEGITKIGNNAFAGNNIKDIVIPSTVTEIGSYAFSTKNYLSETCTLTLPEGLKAIGNRAFRNKVIESVELPSTVTALPKEVFQKEYSDNAEGLVTQVTVTRAQYLDKKNFPASDYHQLVLRADENDTKWDALDFTYGEWTGAASEVTLHPAANTDAENTVVLSPYLVTGLSEYGEAKLEQNKDLVIPDADPEGRQITGIGTDAFKEKGIESVTLPESVMADHSGGAIAEGMTKRGNFIIMSGAFYKNNLTSVNIPEGVIRVGRNAFRGNKLEKVTLPHTIWWIEQTAFAQNVIKIVDFPETCDFKLNIDTQAFAQNEIQAVTLPGRMEKLDRYAFLNNTGAEPADATLPAIWRKSGVVYLYADASIMQEPYIAHTGGSETLLSYAQKLILDEEMPDIYKEWTESDFTYEGTKITGLTENGVIKRTRLPDLVLPDKNPKGEAITEIADSANPNGGLFGTAEEPLTSVVLPDKLVRIGNNAFPANNLKKVVFPETLKEIGTAAFRANQLTEVILPDSLTTLSMGAFTSNAAIEKVVLSKNLTEIPNAVFNSSSAGVTEKFVEIEIPESVTKIGDFAFTGNCFKKVVIPSKVTSIGKSAFAQDPGKPSLRELVLPEGLKVINDYAFKNSLLEQVDLPSTVTTLTKSAFGNTVGTFVTLYTADKAQLTDSEDGRFVAEGTAHKTVYTNLIGTGWQYEDFTFDGETVTGWSESGDQTRLKVKNLVIPEMNPETKETITTIGAKAFAIPDDEWTQLKEGVDSPNGMDFAAIPDTVTEIQDSAFAYNNLVTVQLSDQVKTLGVHAFYSNKLETVVIPDSVTKMGEGAFSSNKLTDLTMSENITVIPQGAFSMNIQMTHVTIPDTVTEIGEFAFAGAPLENLTIPSSVTKIGRKAFHLHHLTELVVPGNVKEIGDSAFEGTFKAIRLKKLTLEEGIESIGSLAFKEGYLEKAELPSTLKTLAPNAFQANSGLDEDHIVRLYTQNKEHLDFEKSDSHVVIYRQFEDIKADSWYNDYVYDVYQRGIMTGMKKTNFGPDVVLSRGQFATILYRMAGEPEVTYTPKFPDVENNLFYSKAVMWANETGVINGYENGNFGPSDWITREQMAAMLYRYEKNVNGSEAGGRGDLAGFPDGDKVSAFAKEAMEWCTDEGLISGNQDGTLAPQDTTSRAVCAAIVSRFVK